MIQLKSILRCEYRVADFEEYLSICLNANKAAVIEISDELYSKIEEAYAEVKRNKDKIPPVVYAKYGNSFDSFVEHILNDFIESAKRTQRFQKTFNDMIKDFDVSKLQDELSSLSSLFGLDKEKQKDKEENKSSDPEKTKN